jgi:hypothetical protein
LQSIKIDLHRDRSTRSTLATTPSATTSSFTTAAAFGALAYRISGTRARR